MAAALFHLPTSRIIDSNGIADGSTLTFYDTGTLTPRAVYTTSALTVEHPNPLTVAAGAAVPDIYLDDAYTYRCIVKNSAGTTIDDIDPYTGFSASGLNFTQTGTGALSATVETALRGMEVYPTVSFGATGDGVADDTAELQACFSSGATKINLGRGKTYKITDTVTIPAGVSVDWGDSIISYAGTRDRAAVVVGAAGASNRMFTLNNVIIRSATVDWSSDTFVGLKVINANRTTIRVHEITGFTRCYEAVGNGQGYTQNNHSFHYLGGGKYLLTLTADGTGGAAAGYVTENTFFGGDYTNLGAYDALGDAYCIHGRTVNGATNPLDNNNWYSPCFQIGDGLAGDERIPVLFEGGATRNSITNARFEGGRGGFGRMAGEVGTGTVADLLMSLNIFSVSVFAGSNTTLTLEQTGSARCNLLRYATEPSFGESEVGVTDLHKKVKSYDTTNFTLVDGLHMTTGDGTPRKFQSPGGIETERDSVRMIGVDRTIGFMVDIEGGESFVVWAKSKPGFKSKLGVIAYDSTRTRLTNLSASYPDIVSDPETSTYNRWSANFGGCYMTGSGVDTWSFTAKSAVKRLQVFVTGGKVQAFGIKRISPGYTPLTRSSGLEFDDRTHYVSGAPTPGPIGVYGRGDLALLDTASGAGLDAYQYTLGGYSAPDWAISTAYAVGQLRQNDIGKIYECVTAGTSAGAGGPTGTGTAIADGTVVWDYLTTQAVATAV